MNKQDDDSGYIGWAIAAWMLVYFAGIIPSARWLVFHQMQENGRRPANMITTSSSAVQQ